MKEPSVGEMIIAGLEDAIAYERGDHSRAREVTRSTLVARLAPPPRYAPDQIAAIRSQLGISRAVFASALNITADTLTAWEEGRRQPSGAAARLLQFANAAPERFIEYLDVLLVAAPSAGGSG